MWKPGESKPGRGGRTPLSQPKKDHAGGGGSKSTPPPISPSQAKEGAPDSAGRNLSTGTLSMKFMQRKAAKEAQVEEDKEKSRAENAAKWTIKEARGGAEGGAQKGPIFEVEETDPKIQCFGRRSFSGFNPVVQRMWEENCEKLGGFFTRTTHKRRSDEITPEEMVRRYKEHGRVPVNREIH